MVGINTNVMALRAQRSLAENNTMVGKSVHRLSTGLRINSAADDAAGLAISKRMDAQAAGLSAAERNANDGISLLKTAEGSLQETSAILVRMSELAIQAANGTNSASDRAAIDSEVNQLKDEITRIASNANFNGLKLLDGSFSAKSFQVGVRSTESINISIGGARGDDLANNRISETNSAVNQGTASISVAHTGDSTANTIGAQTLAVSGTLGSKDISVLAGASAETVAASVNADQGEHGVNATAYSEAKLTSLGADGTVSFDLSTSSGVSANISAAVTQDDLSALVTEINKKTGTTGVSATSVGGELTLVQADGKDIRIKDFSHSIAGEDIKIAAVTTADDGTKTTKTGALLTDDGLTGSAADSTVISGSVYFDSSSSFSVSSSVAASAGSIFSDTTAGATVASSAEKISSIDVTTASGAKTAMRIIDSALSAINSQRADLGATQNRFNSTISNIKTSRENIQAASSQIKDVDYSTETTNLTKAQILSQAATAMLAQANQSGQGVLSLLGVSFKVCK